MVRLLIALAICTACGRVGFDPIDALGDDAIDMGQLVVSKTLLAPATGFTWVALDVDWGRSLAYVGTREAGRCVAVIDFSDEQAPTVVQWIAPGDTICVDVQLLPDLGRVAVLAQASDHVSVWSLGADPRAGNFTLIAQATINSPRHFALDSTGANPQFLVAAKASPGLIALDLVGATLSQVSTWPGACVQDYQAVTFSGPYVYVACSSDNSPVEVVQRAGLASVMTIPNLAPGISGSWVATTMDDGRAVVLGWANMIIQGTTPLARWAVANVSANGYRDVITTDAQTVWAVRETYLERMSLAAPGVPRVTGSADLGAGREVYGLRVAPTLDRAIAVMNNGNFLVLDPRQLPVTDFQPTSL